MTTHQLQANWSFEPIVDMSVRIAFDQWAIAINESMNEEYYSYPKSYLNQMSRSLDCSLVENEEYLELESNCLGLKLFYNDILLREWKPKQSYITCYFEQMKHLSINETAQKYFGKKTSSYFNNSKIAKEIRKILNQ